ncbi:hypothetical protein NL676_034605 [Syzygium grande]|nr:hypothetical protein NL676_034605 [Syzygium grande]
MAWRSVKLGQIGSGGVGIMQQVYGMSRLEWEVAAIVERPSTRMEAKILFGYSNEILGFLLKHSGEISEFLLEHLDEIPRFLLKYSDEKYGEISGFLLGFLLGYSNEIPGFLLGTWVKNIMRYRKFSLDTRMRYLDFSSGTRVIYLDFSSDTRMRHLDFSSCTWVRNMMRYSNSPRILE